MTVLEKKHMANEFIPKGKEMLPEKLDRQHVKDFGSGAHDIIREIIPELREQLVSVGIAEGIDSDDNETTKQIIEIAKTYIRDAIRKINGDEEKIKKIQSQTDTSKITPMIIGWVKNDIKIIMQHEIDAILEAKNRIQIAA